MTWTVRITNNGPDTATGVQLTDVLPSQVSFVSVTTTQGTCSGGGTVTCAIGTLAVGASATVTIVTTALTPTTAGQPALNTAVVVGQQPEANMANNRATAPATILPGELTPPAGVCYSLNLATRSVLVGRRSVIRVTVRAAGRIVRGATVVARGAGVNVRARTNNRGVARLTIRARTPGVIRFNALGQRTCAQRRIGVMGVFQPPLTG
jgi:uncharacterized repeat protein (TIGR01451 family)